MDIFISITIAWLLCSIVSVFISWKKDGFFPEVGGLITAVCLGPFAMVALIRQEKNYEIQRITINNRKELS